MVSQNVLRTVLATAFVATAVALTAPSVQAATAGAMQTFSSVDYVFVGTVGLLGACLGFLSSGFAALAWHNRDPKADPRVAFGAMALFAVAGGAGAGYLTYDDLAKTCQEKPLLRKCPASLGDKPFRVTSESSGPVVYYRTP